MKGIEGGKTNSDINEVQESTHRNVRSESIDVEDNLPPQLSSFDQKVMKGNVSRVSVASMQKMEDYGVSNEREPI